MCINTGSMMCLYVYLNSIDISKINEANKRKIRRIGGRWMFNKWGRKVIVFLL